MVILVQFVLSWLYMFVLSLLLLYRLVFVYVIMFFARVFGVVLLCGFGFKCCFPTLLRCFVAGLRAKKLWLGRGVLRF